MIKIIYKNRNIHYSSLYRYRCSLTKAFVLSRRSINIAVTGAQNQILCKHRNFNFTTTGSFEAYIGPILSVLNEFHPLKNRNTVSSTLVHTLHFAVVLPLVVTTSCYDYIHNNSKTFKLPVGIAKLLDSVCIRTIKHSTVGNAGSLVGVVETNYSLRETIKFLRMNYLLMVNKQYTQELEQLSLFLSTVGYTLRTPELYNVINALVTYLDSYYAKDGILDFGMLLETLSRMSGSILHLPYTNYSTAHSSTENVGIYKFRNSSSDEVYHVTPKGWASVNEIGQQINFVFLAFFLPKYSTNGVESVNINAEDLNLFTGQHNTLSVLRCLFSFQAIASRQDIPREAGEEVDPNPQQAAELLDANANGQRRHFHTFNFNRSKLSFSTQYRRCIIWCSDPLTLSYEDSFPIG